MHRFKCHDCDCVFEVIVDHSKGESVKDTFNCENCDSTNTVWKPSAQIDRFSEQFPYFDRGLDEDKIFSQFDNRRDKEEKEYNDYCDRLDNAPEFLDYRKAVDKGQITL